MLYYVLISVVILAELIISAEIFVRLFKLNKTIKYINSFINESKPKIVQIAKLCNKISEQLTELAPIWVNKLQKYILKLCLNHIKSTLIGFCIWGIKEHLKES